MTIEIKVPTLPESIADATVVTWHKKAGEHVNVDENLVDLETDKVVLEVPAPSSGVIKEIVKNEGDTVLAHEVLAMFEEAGAAAAPAPAQETAAPVVETSASQAATATTTVEAPKIAAHTVSPATTASIQRAATQMPQEPSAATVQAPSIERPATTSEHVSPSVRRMISGLDNSQAATEQAVAPQITKPQQPIVQQAQTQHQAPAPVIEPKEMMGDRQEKRVPMTRLRQRIAERLLEAKNNTAMLTTFNEVNLQKIMDLRVKYKETFEKIHGIRLGFLSFFTRACVEALKQYPLINASIDGNDVVYHGYYDVGIAISTDRGLVVPVVRNADALSMADIEKQIADYAQRARDGKIELEEITGGTFSITNGGVFGSMLSTPILNPPQSAILGMHTIQKRAVVENDEIVIRPMMYLALSYDHRIVDGKEAISFLKTVKELLEDPTRLLLEV
ncbi:MAG: 2-oxoglutarate dehydrogenase complex dihydrolipoyllysine-residue succinyltransferase [Gammaproteobacteria bacterium]